MRDYELTVLMRPDVEGRELVKEVKALGEILSNAGAKVKTKKDPQRRSLSYPIAKFKQADYLFWELEAAPEAVAAIEAKMKLSGKAIRYLLVSK